MTAHAAAELLERTRRFNTEEEVDRAIRLSNDIFAVLAAWSEGQGNSSYANTWLEPAPLRTDVLELLGWLHGAATAGRGVEQRPGRDPRHLQLTGGHEAAAAVCGSCMFPLAAPRKIGVPVCSF